MKTATKKIVLTQKGEINKNIKNALDRCCFDKSNRKIYTGYYSGSGRFTTAHSSSKTLIEILTAQGYKFELLNDAPKGGVKGEHLKVSKTAFNFLKSI